MGTGDRGGGTGDRGPGTGGGTGEIAGASSRSRAPGQVRQPPSGPSSGPSSGPRSPVPGPLPVVHAVTADDVLARKDFPKRARAVMLALGPRGAVHLRGPRVAAARLFALAEALRDAQTEAGAWVVVNDRVDVALAGGARAAQLTSRSMRVADVRRLTATLPLGASVHAADEGAEAERDGANWVVAGHVFETASHPGAAGRGMSLLTALRQATTLPCIAIGGIKPEHVPELLDAGADGVAAISGIWGAADAERAAAEYLSAYDRYCRA